MERTLNEVLEALGYTTEPAGDHGTKRILREGEEVFRGRAGEVWDWLIQTGQYDRAKGEP
jgi:hypothetical protein